MSQFEQARWEALIDREAIGEVLDAEDRAFVDRYEAEHPEAARERAVFEAAIASLHEQLDVQEDPAVLEREAAAALEAYRAVDHEDNKPGNRTLIRGLLVAGFAAAAALALWLGLRDSEPEPERVGEVEQPEAPAPDRFEPVDPSPSPAAPVDPVGRLSMVGGELELGAAVRPGASLSSSGAGEPDNVIDRACVSWTAPTAVVCFEGELSLTPNPAVGERRLRLESGRLVAALAPLGPSQRFTVETTVGTVSAVGTIFAVELHEGRAWVTVLEGRVELRDPTVRALTAGNRTSLRGEVPGDEPTPLSADAIPSALQELVGLAELLRASPGDAELIVPATGDALVRLDDHPLAGPARLSLAAGEHTLRIDDDEQPLVLARGGVTDLGEQLASPSAEAPPVASRTPSAKQLADAAQRSREARDYEETARLYRELLRRYPDSPEAAIVPVRLGDLLASTGDHQGALDAYELYLERGAKQLAPEAELGRIKALRALGRAAEEREAIEAFVTARPDDYRSAELRERL